VYITESKKSHHVLQLVMESSEMAPAVNCTVAVFDSRGQVTATQLMTFAVVNERSATSEEISSPPPLSSDDSPTPPAPVHDYNQTTELELTCIEECGRFNAQCRARRGCSAQVGNIIGGVVGGLAGVGVSTVPALPVLPCT
jgi:hypothetical protein